MSLEEILNTYSPDGEPEEEEPAPQTEPDEEEIREAVAKAARSPRRRRELEVNRTKISFLQSAAAEPESMPMRVNNPSEHSAPERKGTPAVTGDIPKIRRMSDSTRAREIAKNKKRRKTPSRQKEEESYTYDRERPDGEYLYTQIHGAQRAKNRRKVRRTPDLTAAGTETIHLHARDVVSVEQPPEPEPVQPIEVEPAPRAPQTSIDLSAGNAMADAQALDVRISRSPEEAEAETRRQREISDRMKLESASEIRHDIAELRSAVKTRVSSLTLVLFLSGLLVLGETLHIAWVQNMSPVMAAIIQTLLALAAAVVCFPVLKNGFSRLFRLRADTDSLAAVAFIGCAAANAANIYTAASGGKTLPYYLPCAVFALLLHSIGKLLIIRREETNLRLATRRFNCYGMHVVEDEQRADTLARGVLGDFPVLATMRHTNSLTDFRKYTYSADLADRFCRFAAPLSTLFALAASIALTALRSESLTYGLTLFAMFTAASSCAAITFSANLPLLRATKQMSRNGALMLGYQSVDDFYDTNALMADATSLFPAGSVTLAKVKLYTNAKKEETLLAAASLSRQAGSVFGSIFSEVLQGREQKLYPVENVVYEDSMGLCGWIHNQRVLLGNRELMAAHSIEGMPSRTRETELLGASQEAIYLSISGALSAMFMVQLHADEQVKFWAKQTVRNNICLILHSVDPMITLAGLSAMLEVPQGMLKIIPAKLHGEYRAETEPVEHMSASMASTGGFASVAQLLIGAKIIRHSAAFGVFIQAVSILLGLALVLMEATLHVGLTPAKMLLMQLVATLATLIAVNLRRIY